MSNAPTTSASTLTDILFERSSDGLCLVAPDGTVVRVNAEWLQSTGFTEDQVVGEDITALFPDTRDMALAMHARARAGHHVQVPRHAQIVNGRDTWWEGSIEPIPMDGGTGLLITAREIGPALRASESQLRRLYDSGMIGVLHFNLDGAIVDANDRFLEMVGYSRAELKAGHVAWDRMTPPEYGVADEFAIRELKSRGVDTPYEKEYIRKDGSRVSILIGAATCDDARHRGIAFVLDVTERKRAEEALRELTDRNRLLFHNMLDGFAYCRMVYDEDGRPEDFVYLDTNDAFARLTGLHDVVGKRASDVIPGIRESEPELLETYGRVARTGKPERFEAYFRPLAMWLSLSVYSPHANHFAAVFDNITNRKKAEEDLREANRRKDEFLGILSHELRNPLAPIRNATYILQHADPGSEQARRAQGIIERQTEHLTRLVDDLLDVTRIAHGKTELRPERLDLREVLRRSAEDFRRSIEERGVTLHVLVPGAAICIHADATRIAQLVGNLLHNASKFTRRGDDVTLALDADATHASVRVRDTGAGIEPELLPRLFDAFVQGERTLARTEGGLGLGLALVKGIAEMHGGTVRAESAGKGRGAEFIVRLPLAASVQPKLAAEADPKRSSGCRRVLVVDDNRDAAESLADILRLRGHTADVAYDGPSAIEKVRTLPPDVVFCDIGLPGMSGYDVARTLRDLAHDGVQLIAVSGYAQAEDVKRAIEAGFDGHVAKPCDPEKIERLLS